MRSSTSPLPTITPAIAPQDLVASLGHPVELHRRASSDAMTRASAASDGPRPNGPSRRLLERIGRAASAARERDEPRPQQMLEVRLAPRTEPDLVVEARRARIGGLPVRPALTRLVDAPRRPTLDGSPDDRAGLARRRSAARGHRSGGSRVGRYRLRDEELGQRDRGAEGDYDHQRGDEAGTRLRSGAKGLALDFLEARPRALSRSVDPSGCTLNRASSNRRVSRSTARCGRTRRRSVSRMNSSGVCQGARGTRARAATRSKRR